MGKRKLSNLLTIQDILDIIWSIKMQRAQKGSKKRQTPAFILKKRLTKDGVMLTPEPNRALRRMTDSAIRKQKGKTLRVRIPKVDKVAKRAQERRDKNENQ